MNEIIVRPSVEHQVGSVQFHNYDEILNQALELAEYVSSVVVTEESVKATKKMLATVNKKVIELEDGRKAIKKSLLAPYEEFESQIKTIAKVVKDADNLVRSQVKELEEKERLLKKDEIVMLWHKRSKLYPTLTMFAPKDFITNQHLNKTMSLDKVEKEMVEWFEERKKDVEFLNIHPQADDLLVEYIKNQNIVDSMNIIIQRNQAKEEITNKQAIKKETSVTIVIDGNDLTSVEAFMKLSNINYTLKRGN